MRAMAATTTPPGSALVFSALVQNRSATEDIRSTTNTSRHMARLIHSAVDDVTSLIISELLSDDVPCVFAKFG
jgi:FPC/CPF motif-containing protein YcgG